MKTLRLLSALAVLLVGLAAPVAAQVSIDSPTFSSAVSPTADTVVLSSVTCTGCTFGPGTTIYTDLEQMIVSGTYVTGTTVPVIRTTRAAHVSGATLYIGPASRFQKNDPPQGACNKVVQAPFYPWVNVVNGLVWLCDNGQNAYTAVKWRALVPYTANGTAGSR